MSTPPTPRSPSRPKPVRARRGKWFAALSRDWCTWRYGGTRDDALAVGQSMITETEFLDAKGFWIAPSHRSRIGCDTDCQEHDYTVESESAEWIPRLGIIGGRGK